MKGVGRASMAGTEITHLQAQSTVGIIFPNQPWHSTEIKYKELTMSVA